MTGFCFNRKCQLMANENCRSLHMAPDWEKSTIMSKHCHNVDQHWNDCTLDNANDDQGRELANTLNNLHQHLEIHCEISKHEVTFTDLIIYKWIRREKEGKKRKKRESRTLERPTTRRTLFRTWPEDQLIQSQYVVGWSNETQDNIP